MKTRTPPRVFRSRLLVLALLAIICQATLPFFALSCPVYAGADHAISTPSAMQMDMAGMPDDCPMAQSPPAGHEQDTPHKTGKSCPLCEVMSPFHGFVAAGLLDLPPPPPLVPERFAAVFPPIVALKFRAAFAARAPPAVV